MVWQNPKTDWATNPIAPTGADFNRIEGNIDFLKNDIETKKGLIVDAIVAMGQSASVNDTHAVLAAKIQDISDDANTAVEDVLTGKTFYQGGTKKTGTMPNRGAHSIIPGAADIAIPAGYHSGVGVVYGDPDLTSANIKAGANVFGVPGKTEVVDTTEAIAPAVAANIINGKKAFVNGALITGSMTDRTNQENDALNETVYNPGTGNRLYLRPAAGYYPGAGPLNQARSSPQPDLIATNILSGKNIFGVAGTARPVAVGQQNSSAGKVLSVRGLAFQPNFIIANLHSSSYGGMRHAYLSNQITTDNLNAIAYSGGTIWGGKTFTIYSDGFDLVTYYANAPYYYVVVG